MNNYRRIWLGNASSNLADGVNFVALPLLAATLTDNPAHIATLSVAYTLPRLLSVLGIGVLVDRLDRRRLLYLASFSRGVLFAALTLLVIAGATSMPLLYLVYEVMGVIETLADSAAVSILPQAVPAAQLDRANSQIAGTQVVIDEFVGPPLGGFLFGVAVFAPSLLNTVAFMLAGVAYLGLRGTYRLPAPEANQTGQGFTHQIYDGMRWAWGQVLVRTLMLVGGLASVGYMIPFSYLVLYTDKVLGLTPTGYGVLLSVTALGGLAGSLVAAPLRRLMGYGWTIIAALLLGAASFAVVAVTDELWAVTLALTTYIAHSVVWNVMATSVRQKATPAQMMGRVGSVGKIVSIGGLTTGAALGGALVTHLGYRVPFGMASGFFVLGALLIFLALGHFQQFELSDRQVSE